MDGFRPARSGLAFALVLLLLGGSRAEGQALGIGSDLMIVPETPVAVNGPAFRPTAMLSVPKPTSAASLPRICPPRSTPWHLPQPGFLQAANIRLGGWLEQGITFNAVDPADRFNGPVATNDLDGEYQMNQMWLFLDRPADNGGCGFAWGGHLDMVYGTDWRFGINRGLEDRINGFNRQTYGMVIPRHTWSSPGIASRSNWGISRGFWITKWFRLP